MTHRRRPVATEQRWSVGVSERRVCRSVWIYKRPGQIPGGYWPGRSFCLRIPLSLKHVPEIVLFVWILIFCKRLHGNKIGRLLATRVR